MKNQRWVDSIKKKKNFIIWVHDQYPKQVMNKINKNSMWDYCSFSNEIWCLSDISILVRRLIDVWLLYICIWQLHVVTKYPWNKYRIIFYNCTFSLAICTSFSIWIHENRTTQKQMMNRPSCLSLVREINSYLGI